MTGPDGAHNRNKARVRGPGTAYQAGQIHGDASMGNTDNSRSTTISLGAFGMVLGVVMTLAVGLGAWKLFASDGRPDGASVTATPRSAETGQASTRTNTSPDGAKEVRLIAGTGVDVDGNDATATPVDGATGETDLYFDRFSLVYANEGGFWSYAGPEQDAQQLCTKAVAGGKNTEKAILPTESGSPHCFATSDGQVGLLRVKKGYLTSAGSDSSIVLAVHVWPRP